MNDVAWSSTLRLFGKISGLLDPRVGQGMYNTFHVGIPLLCWPLDHLFHSSHFTIKNIKRLPFICLDHFSLFTQFVFRPQQMSRQEGVASSDEDNRFAGEFVEEKAVSKNDVPTLNE